MQKKELKKLKYLKVIMTFIVLITSLYTRINLKAEAQEKVLYETDKNIVINQFEKNDSIQRRMNTNNTKLENKGKIIKINKYFSICVLIFAFFSTAYVICIYFGKKNYGKKI